MSKKCVACGSKLRPENLTWRTPSLHTHCADDWCAGVADGLKRERKHTTEFLDKRAQELIEMAIGLKNHGHDELAEDHYQKAGELQKQVQNLLDGKHRRKEDGD